MRQVPALLIVTLLSASGCDKRPATQQAFTAEWRALRAEWKAREDNDVLRNETKATAKAFFSAKRPVARWTATVDRVASVLGSSWIIARADGMTFHLRPPEQGVPQFQDFLRKVSPGVRVVFDGETASELSVTMAGAILDPEISVTLLRIEAPDLR